MRSLYTDTEISHQVATTACGVYAIRYIRYFHWNGHAKNAI